MRAKTDSAIYRPDLGIQVMEYVEGLTMGYIGLQVMPIFEVGKQSASFPVVPKEALLSVPEVERAPRGTYNRGDWEYERGLFATSEKGWEEPIDDSEEGLAAQEGLDLGFIATKRAMGHILRAQEKRIAAKVFDAVTFTPVTITEEWDDATNAVPIDDIETGKLAMRSACGMLPDCLVIAYSTFSNLKQCDQIVNRLKYTFPGIDINRMNSAQLAAVFDVPEVLIGGAVYNTAGRGLDASISDLWDHEYAALIKRSMGNDISAPGFGRTFLWTEDSRQNPIVEQYREEARRSDIYRVRHHVDERLIQSFDNTGAVKSNIADACIYLMDNITT